MATPITSPPSHSARRAAVEAARDAADVARIHGGGGDPWERATDQAEKHLRREIAVALKDLEHDMGHAAHILDTAHRVAAEASGRLVDAAWDAWKKYMAEAEHAEKRVLEPAYETYKRVVEQAKDEFTKHLDTATRGYQQELAAAEEARSRSAAMHPAKSGS